MKLYKKLLYTMCMAGSITLTGCDDFLTPDNKSAVNDVEYFTTSAGLQVWGIERSGFFNGREKWAKGFENQRV